jgi:hypothetical protein
VAADEEHAKRFVADLVGEMRFERRQFPLGVFGQARQCLGVGSLPPQRVDRQVAGGAVEPAGRVFKPGILFHVNRAASLFLFTASSARRGNAWAWVRSCRSASIARLRAVRFSYV